MPPPAPVNRPPCPAWLPMIDELTTVSVPSLEMPPPTPATQKDSPLADPLIGTAGVPTGNGVLHPPAVMPLRFPVICVRFTVSVPEFMIPPPPVTGPQTLALTQT